MQAINIGIVCVGNCASSLVQGLSHYRAESNDHSGLMHWELGGYRPCDIRLAAAWDIDRRKVGRDIAEAIFARPNRSEERRVGKECVSTCRSRWSPDH